MKGIILRFCKKTTLVGLVTSALVATTLATAPPSFSVEDNVAPYDAVNMWIGTYYDKTQNKGNSAYGNTWPGATLPFGMTQFTPTTYDTKTGDAGGGYEYTADQLRGFGMTRLSGTGCWGRNGAFEIPLLPYSGPLTEHQALPQSPGTDIKNYYLDFSHDQEEGAPGYYRVNLDNGVLSELTATTRTTAGRFSYPEDADSATLIFNVAGANNKTGSKGPNTVTIDPENRTITGESVSKTVCDEGYSKLYFSAQFDQDFESYGTWTNGEVQPENLHAEATDKDGTGAYFTFPTGTEVGIKTGISYVSVENAELNRQTEADEKSFDDIQQEAKETWEEALGRIAVEGNTRSEKVQFYTALYHALLNPMIYEDVNGQYRGYGERSTLEGDVLSLKEGQDHEYVTWSSWDTLRSQAQLLGLLFPERASDMAQSIVNMAEQTGQWYNWPHLGAAQHKMEGDGLQIVLAELDAFGSKNYDRQAGLDSMLDTQSLGDTMATQRKNGIYYAAVGWLEDRQNVATSTTMDLTMADFAISQMASRLGDEEAAATYLQRSQNWRNLVSQSNEESERNRIVPRDRKGHWNQFDLRNRNYSANKPDSGAANEQFDQSTGLQYQWYVPYDVESLIEELGGKEVAEAKLDNMLRQLDHSGVTSDYTYMSNQPSMHIPWIYHWLNHPNKTTEVLDRIVAEEYFDDVIVEGKPGIPGNDDLGSFGAWYVWLATGLYPAIFGTADLLITAPRFETIIISPEGGAPITINAPGATENRTITGVTVDGHNHSASYLDPSFVETGGNLDIELGTEPGTWGTTDEDLPPSYRGDTDGFNAVGTTLDGSRNSGSLEFSGNSLSRNELAANGVTPGVTLDFDGISFEWPFAPPLQPDHWIPWGQHVDMEGKYAEQISFLGLATNGPSQGTAEVVYRDGSSLRVPVYFSDWTPGSIGEGNTPVLELTKRNNINGTQNNSNVKIFATSPTALDPTKAIDYVALPNDVQTGIMHIFSVGLQEADPPAPLPAQVTNVIGSENQGQITLSWNPVIDPENAPVTEYLIYRDNDPQPVLSIPTPVQFPIEVGEFPPGTYQFEVSAVNAIGEGEKSVPAEVTVSPSTPPELEEFETFELSFANEPKAGHPVQVKTDLGDASAALSHNWFLDGDPVTEEALMRGEHGDTITLGPNTAGQVLSVEVTARADGFQETTKSIQATILGEDEEQSGGGSPGEPEEGEGTERPGTPAPGGLATTGAPLALLLGGVVLLAFWGIALRMTRRH